MSKMTNLKEIACYRMFGGYQRYFQHDSKVLGCTMKFSIYMPPPSCGYQAPPVVYWLSGLECTEKNFMEKAGAQRYAAEQGVVLVAPDTSPRGLNIPGEDVSWDFGTGAGFYVDATQEPWSKNYRMYTYVTEELPSVINENFKVSPALTSIMGHSMGGHGALICALKNPGKYQCVTAFAPIANPIKCPWGQKAFTGYLGPQETGKWEDWDATELMKKYKGPPLNIIIDQGSDDKFYLEGQLNPEAFVEACQEADSPVIFHVHDGYDHSYYFIHSYIGDHMLHHARILHHY